MTQEAVFEPKPRRFGSFTLETKVHPRLLTAFLLQYVILSLVTFLSSTFFNGRSFARAISALLDPEEMFYDFINLGAFWLIFYFVSRHPRLLNRILPIGHIFVPEQAKINSEIVRHAVEKEASYSEGEGFVARRLLAIDAIDERIGGLRARSSLMLSSIGILLIASAIIIVFAGSLTNLDVSAASDVDKISTLITETETKIGRLSEMSELRKSLADPAKKDYAEKRLNSLAPLFSGLPAEEAATQTLITAQQNRLADQRELLKTAWNKQLTAEHGYADTRYIVATAITRIGVVLIIVFLVQILIGLYRYNARLITFYNSRRDFLQLWDGKPPNLDKLQRVMAANVDFGKEPKHPLEDIIRQAMSKLHLPGTSVGTTSVKV
jgi:hypothetical protein